MEELPGTIFGRLLEAIEGPVGLLLLLVVAVLAVVVIVLRRENQALYKRIDELQEQRVQAALRGTPVFEQVTQVLSALEGQARKAREERSPLLERLDLLIDNLERKAPPVRRPAAGA
jgi:predicted Holliday junction resolvase-like endonuclease